MTSSRPSWARSSRSWPSGRAPSAEGLEVGPLSRAGSYTSLVAAIALLLSLLPSRAGAEAPPKRQSVAVVITQSVGVGPLADRIGNLIHDRIARGVYPAVSPGAASSRLRLGGGTDPLTCGSESACLREVGSELGAGWIVGVGIGHFGGMIGLELQALEVAEERPPAVLSSTWRAPGPDWESTIEASLPELLPAELLQPAGLLFVEADEVGVELRIDGEVVGETPLAQPLRLLPGRHRVELVHAGFASQRHTVYIEAEETTSLPVALMPLQPRRSLRPWSYSAAGGAVATFVGAVLLHTASNRAEEEARELRWSLDPLDDLSAANARQQIARDRRVASNWLFGTSAALATTAIGLFLLEPASPPPSAEAAAP